MVNLGEHRYKAQIKKGEAARVNSAIELGDFMYFGILTPKGGFLLTFQFQAIKLNHNV